MYSLAAAAQFEQPYRHLYQWLDVEGYPAEAILRILDHVWREGTLAGAPDLDPADEEWAEHEFVEGQEPVVSVSAEWDEHATEPSRGPVYRSVDGDYALDRLSFDLERLRAEVPAPDDDWPRDWTAEEKAAARRDIADYIRTHSDRF